VDRKGAAQDVSGFTTILVNAMPPDSREAVTATGAYVTDGSDGKVQFSWADGDIDREGNWSIQIEFAKTDVRALSYLGEMQVGAALKTPST
jgi:hypothetical protein